MMELQLRGSTTSHLLSSLPLPSGERLFPPPSGLSYSTWFCVERFSAAPHAHPVRLLTVVRRATSSEQHYVCLAVVLSAKDRSLTVSTKEELLQTYCKKQGHLTWHRVVSDQSINKESTAQRNDPVTEQATE